MHNWIAQNIDGNWIDIGSIIFALVYAKYKSGKRSGKFICQATGIDFANGASLFPLLLLGLSFVSSHLLSELLSANCLILSIAGFAALFSVLDD